MIYDELSREMCICGHNAVLLEHMFDFQAIENLKLILMVSTFDFFNFYIPGHKMLMV